MATNHLSTVPPAGVHDRLELEALRESEARFRQLADNLPHGFIYQIVQDEQGQRFSYVSGGVEALFGVTAAQVTADPGLMYRMIVEEDFPRMRVQEEEALRLRKPFDCRFRVRTPRGELRWLHCRSAPRDGPRPGASVWDGIAIDITERTTAEQGLGRERELLQTIIDAIPVMITLYEPDTKVLRLNAEFERVTGWNVADAAGVSLMEDCYPDPAYREEVRGFMQTCAGGWKDFRMRTRDGRDVPTSWANIRLSDGRQVGIGLDTTERERSEAALRESEAAFRAIFDLAGVGKAQADPATGRFVRVNRKLCEITGYTADELLARTFADITHPDDRERDVALFHRLVSGELAEESIDKRYVRKDGTTIWVHLTATMIRDAQGRPLRATAVIQDIGERRGAEQALRRSETRFRKLVEQSPLSIQIQAPDGHTLQVNRAWEQLWGVPREEHLADYNMLRDEQIEARGLMPFVRRAFEGASVETPPVCYVPARGMYCGRERWVRAFLYPVKDAEGLVEEVVVIHEDITERRHAGEALRESEERLRLALDAGRCGVWDWEIPRGRVTWSQRIYEFHGLAPGAFGNRAEDFLALVHPDDADRVREAIRAAVEEGKPYGQEFRIVRPGGEVRWLASNGRVLFDEAKRAVRMLGATIDVTERRAAEEALREADRRKDEFLAMLAHELRNPLAPIRNATQVIKLIGPADPNLAKARDMIDRQVAHVARLVDDLLDVSRITRGKILLRKERLHLVPLVRAAVEDHRALLEGTGLTLSVELPAGPLWVEGDPTRLAQVVGNLLHNANKFTDAGGHVAVRLAAETNEAVLSVRDTGIGMGEDILARLFEPFSQADRSLDRSRGGLGLGLALVKGLAELHGGGVRAASAGPGKGSEFTVRIPLSRRAGRVIAPGGAGAPGRPLRVLVIEDHLDAAESLRMLLQLSGHEVAVAHAGKIGLELARSFRPDVVLCDIGLPGGMDGYAVAAAVRRDPELATLPLIALSGYGQEEDQRRARQAGFDRHLTKPVDPRLLEQLLGNIAG
jgi:PAS domain S-box-containing protein